MGDQEILVLHQEMSISREEFLRLLPAAVAHDRFSVDGEEIRHPSASRSWRIVVRAMADRQLGQLLLPSLEVQIFLRGFSPAETGGFLERLELHFRRAGG